MIQTETPGDLADLAWLRRLAATGSLRNVRDSAGMTLAEASRVAGVPERSVYRWERSQVTPRGPSALRYARLLRGLLGGSA